MRHHSLHFEWVPSLIEELIIPELSDVIKSAVRKECLVFLCLRVSCSLVNTGATSCCFCLRAIEICVLYENDVMLWDSAHVANVDADESLWIRALAQFRPCVH